MTVNGQLLLPDRHKEIMTLYRARPDMTLKQIGAQFGITGPSVSQIVSGRRGKRRENRIAKIGADPGYDAEFTAIRKMMDALADLTTEARERVASYVLARLRADESIDL